MVLLGIHYFFVKMISPHIPGPTVAFLSCAVAIPAAAVYIYLTGLPWVTGQAIFLGYTPLTSILMSVGILTLYVAIQKGPISVVMPIFSLNAMVTAILGIVILSEPISVERLLGLVLAMAAIVLLSR